MHRPVWSAAPSLVALMISVACLTAGCGSNSSGGTSPEVAQAQHSASEAWNKAKSDGSVRQKPASTNGQGASSRGRSHR